MTMVREACRCSQTDTPTWEALFPPDLLDPWDAESPPELWPDDTDADRWTADEPDPTPIGDDDHLANYEPSDQERAEAAAMFAQMDAESFLNTGDRMTLEGLVRHSADFYRQWSTQAGELIADTLDGLADRIAFTRAATPGELAARESVLDEDIDDIEVYRRNCREPISRDEARERLRRSWMGL